MASSSSNNATAAASGASDAWSNWNNATAAASGASDAWSNWNNNAAAAASGASSEDASNNATAAASGAPDADTVLLDRVVAVISSRRKYNAGLTWKRLLANHTHRSKRNGGRVVDGYIDNYMTYLDISDTYPRTYANRTIRATLEIPHSFTYGDNAACGATVTSWIEEDGKELACKMALATLFVRDTNHYPDSMLTVHEANWTIGVADLLREVRAAVVGHPPPQLFCSPASGGPANVAPPIPMPTTRRQRTADDLYDEPPDDHAQHVEEIKAMLRQMIETNGGETTPTFARQIRATDDHRTRCSKLQELREFLDADGSDEFEYTTKPANDGSDQVLYTIKFRQGQPAAPHTTGPAAAAAANDDPWSNWQHTAPAAHVAPNWRQQQ